MQNRTWLLGSTFKDPNPGSTLIPVRPVDPIGEPFCHSKSQTRRMIVFLPIDLYRVGKRLL